MSPFYANYGFHPVAMDLASTEPLNPASKVYAHWMHTVHDESRKGLEEAQERIRRYTDPNRKTPPAYQVGDLVMLRGRNIKMRRASKKLDHKIMVSSKSKKSSLPLRYVSHFPANGKYTMFSMCRYSSPIEPANTEHLRTRPRCCEKRTTSNSRRNTTWKKLCPRSSVAKEITNESYISSNGSTIQNAKTGQKNRSTTFR